MLQNSLPFALMSFNFGPTTFPAMFFQTVSFIAIGNIPKQQTSNLCFVTQSKVTKIYDHIHIKYLLRFEAFKVILSSFPSLLKHQNCHQPFSFSPYRVIAKSLAKKLVEGICALVASFLIMANVSVKYLGPQPFHANQIQFLQNYFF